MKHHNCRRLQAVLGLGVLAALGLAQVLSAYASGVLYVAPAGNDANDCLAMSSACRTIPAAVGKASAGDTIVISGGIYTENVTIDKDLTLIGFGADATIIDEGHVLISHATVQIFDMAMTRGHGGGGSGGGALFNDSGIVTLGYTSILSSHASYGGGLYNYGGTLVLDHSLVENNSAIDDGGGIFTTLGGVSISHSIIVSNTACNTACLYGMGRNSTGQKPDYGFESHGGGIFNEDGAVSIDTSAIISNSAANRGDGIYSSGLLVITNSTIANNWTLNGAFYGSGLWNDGAATLTNVTLSENQYLGLISYGPTQLKNTIIANTTGGSNCTGGGLVSLGHNLSSDGSCSLTASGDLTNTNPLLGSLADNGGPTPTQALLPGSPAINHGDNAGCPPTDQRGIPRPQAGLCDIGAYEYVFPLKFFLPLIAR